MRANEVRPWSLRSQDPIAVVIAGVALAIVTSDLHELIGVTGEQIASWEASALILGGIVRFLLERRNDRRLAEQMGEYERSGRKTNPELSVGPDPSWDPSVATPVQRRGADAGEGGQVERVDDDVTPSRLPADLTSTTERKPRQG